MKASGKRAKNRKRSSMLAKRKIAFEGFVTPASEFNRNHPGYIKSKTCGLLSRNVNKDGEAIIGDGLLYASTLTNIDLHPAVSRFFRSSNIQDFLGELNDEDGLGLRLSEISITEDDANRYYRVFARAFQRYDEREVTTRLISLMSIIYEEKSEIASSEFIAHQDWGILAGGLLAFSTDNDPNPGQPAAFAHKADIVALNEDKSQIKACIELEKRQVRRDANGTRSLDGPDSLKIQTLGGHFGSGAKYTFAVRLEGFAMIFNRKVSAEGHDPELIECYMAPAQGMYQFDFLEVRHAFCLALYGIARMCSYTVTRNFPKTQIDLSSLSVEQREMLFVSKPPIEHSIKAPTPKCRKTEKASNVKRLVRDIDGNTHVITALNITNSNTQEEAMLEELGDFMHLQELEQGVEDGEELYETLKIFKLFLLEKREAMIRTPSENLITTS